MDKRAVGAWLALLLAAVVGIVLGVSVNGDDEAQAAPWERVASMSQRRSYIAAAKLDGKIYTAGGMVGETGRPLALASRYDAVADRWEVLPRLPVETRAAAGAAADGRFYVIGGTTPEGNTDAVWAYDPAREEWEERAPLRHRGNALPRRALRLLLAVQGDAEDDSHDGGEQQREPRPDRPLVHLPS